MKQVSILSSVGAAATGNRDEDTTKTRAEKGLAEAIDNVEHFVSVQTCRRKVAQSTSKKMTKVIGNMTFCKPPADSSLGKSFPSSSQTSFSSSQGKRKLLLRIGTISPFQYFGDQQVSNNDVYPVSLVSDPTAEIYLMTKHDILRRLPKKLFSALFTGEADPVPSDLQLMGMPRQTERWDSFRWSMHGNAATSGRRAGLNASANLKFLGANSSVDPRRILPRRRGVERNLVSLTPKDEEHFSQASARFLRNFDNMRKDTGLRTALAKAGLDRRRHLSGCLRDDYDESQDPMSFHFDQHWSKLRKDPIGLGTPEPGEEGANDEVRSALLTSTTGDDLSHSSSSGLGKNTLPVREGRKTELFGSATSNSRSSKAAPPEDWQLVSVDATVPRHISTSPVPGVSIPLRETVKTDANGKRISDSTVTPHEGGTSSTCAAKTNENPSGLAAIRNRGSQLNQTSTVEKPALQSKTLKAKRTVGFSE